MLPEGLHGSESWLWPEHVRLCKKRLDSHQDLDGLCVSRRKIEDELAQNRQSCAAAFGMLSFSAPIPWHGSLSRPLSKDTEDYWCKLHHCHKPSFHLAISDLHAAIETLKTFTVFPAVCCISLIQPIEPGGPAFFFQQWGDITCILQISELRSIELLRFGWAVERWQRQANMNRSQNISSSAVSTKSLSSKFH